MGVGEIERVQQVRRLIQHLYTIFPPSSLEAS